MRELQDVRCRRVITSLWLHHLVSKVISQIAFCTMWALPRVVKVQRKIQFMTWTSSWNVNAARRGIEETSVTTVYQSTIAVDFNIRKRTLLTLARPRSCQTTLFQSWFRVAKKGKSQNHQLKHDTLLNKGEAEANRQSLLSRKRLVKSQIMLKRRWWEWRAETLAVDCQFKGLSTPSKNMILQMRMTHKSATVLGHQTRF